MNRSTDDIAASLEAMTSTQTVTLHTERRSLENPALPVNPNVLDGIWGYGPTRSGVQINEDTALTFAAVFAAVKVLSESIGMLPLAVYEGDDDVDVKERALDHPAYKLLRWSPNDESTAAVFKESLQANLTLWGRCYARIERNNADDPIALRPVQSSAVTAERFGGQLRYVVRGGQGGKFAPEEMIYIPGLSLNGITALSPVAYCREAIATGKAAEIFGATFFGNGAHLDGTLEFPKEVQLKPEQIAAISESWNAIYAGVGNSHKTGIVPFGGSFKQIGCPPEDAQFLETRRFSVEEIARIYRIPPHMLGDLSRSTNNNIEHASIEFLVYTLLPWLEKWEQELTRKLCGADGKFHVKFDDRRLLRTDVTARQAFYQSGLQWGYLNPDECRAWEGLKPLPKGQGKVYRSPVNMEPMSNLVNKPATPPPAPGATNTPPPAVNPPATPPVPASAAAGVRSFKPFVTDALSRMHRKEQHAVTRGTADEDFYATHRRHIRESLMPLIDATTTVGGKTDSAMQIIAAIADAKHGPDYSAEADADRILSAIEAP